MADAYGEAAAELARTTPLMLHQAQDLMRRAQQLGMTAADAAEHGRHGRLEAVLAVLRAAEGVGPDVHEVALDNLTGLERHEAASRYRRRQTVARETLGCGCPSCTRATEHTSGDLPAIDINLAMACAKTQERNRYTPVEPLAVTGVIGGES